MNPYLEQPEVWHMFRKHLVVYVSECLAEVLGARYFVAIGRRTYLHELPAEDRAVFGAIDKVHETFVEIQSREGGVITVIEILSFGSKNLDADRNHYLAHRWGDSASSPSIVEIDLLRGGERLKFDETPSHDYRVTIRLNSDVGKVAVYPIGLRDRLPVIPIPLQTGDPNAPLDLQALLHRVYDAGRYIYKIHDGKPQPALKPEDHAWAESILAQSRET